MRGEGKIMNYELWIMNYELSIHASSLVKIESVAEEKLAQSKLLYKKARSQPFHDLPNHRFTHCTTN